MCLCILRVKLFQEQGKARKLADAMKQLDKEMKKTGKLNSDVNSTVNNRMFRFT